MPKTITITTDGSTSGTVLTVDGKEITKDEKVVGINLYASASYISKYSGDRVPGYTSVSYDVVKDGKIETTHITESATNYDKGVGEASNKEKSSVTSEDSIIRHIGEQYDKDIVDLVDKIEVACKEKNIMCPPREVLLCRSFQSLKDKAVLDIGIKLEG